MSGNVCPKIFGLLNTLAVGFVVLLEALDVIMTHTVVVVLAAVHPPDFNVSSISCGMFRSSKVGDKL